MMYTPISEDRKKKENKKTSQVGLHFNQNMIVERRLALVVSERETGETRNYQNSCRKHVISGKREMSSRLVMSLSS